MGNHPPLLLGEVERRLRLPPLRRNELLRTGRGEGRPPRLGRRRRRRRGEVGRGEGGVVEGAALEDEAVADDGLVGVGGGGGEEAAAAGEEGGGGEEEGGEERHAGGGDRISNIISCLFITNKLTDKIFL